MLAPFLRRAREAEARGLIRFAFRHRVDGFIVTDGCVEGVHGAVLAPDDTPRGTASNRSEIGAFEHRAQAVILASGGIGGNHDLVRDNWPARLGPPPLGMVAGVPAHVDGRMIAITEAIGGNLINRDRMWHYTEGILNFDPIWANHGIRIIPGPSSLWLDAFGRRMPAPCYPGYDSLATLEHICKSGADYTWFVTTQSIVKKEFALSGSEQNPDITNKDWRLTLSRAFGKKAAAPVEAFKAHGADFVVRDDLASLVAGMNAIAGNARIELAALEAEIVARDREIANPFSKDAQVMGIMNARRALSEKLVRTAKPHRLLDPAHGPLIAVRLSILTRKTLGGFACDLDGRVLGRDGAPIAGLYAAGEAAGFGGGGMHGYRALEGTFLGGCLFSGRVAGRAAASAVA
ncbi:KsdD-like steroid dehydrogenase [Beijerinckiaceae bacterium RH AL1]|nr:KsdD-like steroid dehydrogenase [Beijerinckiaceae bacterium RH AL1]